MNARQLLSALLLTGLISSSNVFAATTTYARRAAPATPVPGVTYCWDVAVTDAAIGSDNEANGTGIWRYETVVAMDDTNQLGGTAPWYALPSSDPMTWNSASPTYWEGVGTQHVTVPRVQQDRLRPSNTTANFGYLVRMVWVAPEDGTLSLKGTMNLYCGSGVTATVDWAIGKKIGTTYQAPLASGTINATSTAQSLQVETNPVLQNVALNAGEGLYVTLRPTAPLATGGGNVFIDDFPTTYEFTTLAGVEDWQDR